MENLKPINNIHEMQMRRCLLRTYSAGVHIGYVVHINPNNSKECLIHDCLRLWEWSDSGLSLSSVAREGIKNGRLDYVKEIYLTEVIEYIPTTEIAEKSFEKFVQNKKNYTYSGCGIADGRGNGVGDGVGYGSGDGNGHSLGDI